jgi:hypothetical protein
MKAEQQGLHNASSQLLSIPPQMLRPRAVLETNLAANRQFRQLCIIASDRDLLLVKSNAYAAFVNASDIVGKS